MKEIMSAEVHGHFAALYEMIEKQNDKINDLEEMLEERLSEKIDTQIDKQFVPGSDDVQIMIDHLLKETLPKIVPVTKETGLDVPEAEPLFNLKSTLKNIPVPITVSNHMYTVAARACTTKRQVAKWAISHGLTFLEDCLGNKPEYFTKQTVNIDVEVYEHVESDVVTFCEENDIQDIDSIYALLISEGMTALFH